MIILLELGELFFANSNCSQEHKYDNCRDMQLKIPHLFVFKHPQPFSVSCEVSHSRTIKIHLSSQVFSVYYPNDKYHDPLCLFSTKCGKTFLHAVACYAKPKAFFFLFLYLVESVFLVCWSSPL